MGRTLKARELRMLVRLLLVAHARDERRAVGYAVLAGLTDDEAGQRMGIGPERVRELLGSVRARVREASERRRRDETLQRLGMGGNA